MHSTRHKQAVVNLWSPQPNRLSTYLNSNFLFFTTFRYLFVRKGFSNMIEPAMCRAFVIHGLAHGSLWSYLFSPFSCLSIDSEVVLCCRWRPLWTQCNNSIPVTAYLFSACFVLLDCAHDYSSCKTSRSNERLLIRKLEVFQAHLKRFSCLIANFWCFRFQILDAIYFNPAGFRNNCLSGMYVFFLF